MLIVDRFYCVVAQKTLYKVWLRIVFVDMNSPNPLFYSCKFLPYQKQYTFLDFYENNPIENENAFAIGGRLPVESVHALCVCVCFCVFPSLNLNENPIRSETSVREKDSTLSVTYIFNSEVDWSPWWPESSKNEKMVFKYVHWINSDEFRN